MGIVTTACMCETLELESLLERKRRFARHVRVPRGRTPFRGTRARERAQHARLALVGARFVARASRAYLGARQATPRRSRRDDAPQARVGHDARAHGRRCGAGCAGRRLRLEFFEHGHVRLGSTRRDGGLGPGKGRERLPGSRAEGDRQEGDDPLRDAGSAGGDHGVRAAPMREHARERRVPVRCASRRVRRMKKTERRVASFHFPRESREKQLLKATTPFPGCVRTSRAGRDRARAMAWERVQCQHGRRRENCAKCVGCEHGKLRNNCALCTGCPHGRVRRKCVQCNPCPHGRVKGNCPACSPCPHGKMKSHCPKCQACPHGKWRQHCATCHPCPHGKLKYDCKECSGCEHGRLRRRCGECKQTAAAEALGALPTLKKRKTRG